MPSREDPPLRSPARWQVIVGGTVLPFAIVVGWFTVSAAGVLPALPSPQAVVLAGIDLAERGLLFHDVSISIQRVLTGFALGSAIGLLLGALVIRSHRARILLSPTISAVRSVPTMAWLPALVLYLGIGEAPKVALIAIGAVIPAFATMLATLGTRDLQAGRPLRVAIPSAVTGLRSALTQSWVILVAAELLHSSMGLGFLLADSSNSGRIDRLFVAMVLLATLAKGTDGLIGLVERRLAGSSG